MLSLSEKLDRVAALQVDRVAAENDVCGNGFFTRLVAAAPVPVPVRVRKTKPNGRPLRLFKVGGLWHWRVGRFGGTLYIARRAALVAALIAIAGAAHAGPVDDIARCMASGNTFVACATYIYHNETTENGTTVLRGNDPVVLDSETIGETTILRGGN